MRILFGLAMAFLLSSCGSTTSMLGSWKDDSVQAAKDFDKTMVLAITKSAANRRLIETQMVESLGKEGINAVSSFAIFDADILTEKTSKEALKEELKAQGVDAVLSVSLVSKDEETHYQPGTSMYAPMGYPMYGGFYGYYGNRAGYAYDPGYYSESMNYFLESNFYDLDKDEGKNLIWSAQTKTMDPSNVQSGVNSYVDSVVRQMKKDGVLNP